MVLGLCVGVGLNGVGFVFVQTVLGLCVGVGLNKPQVNTQHLLLGIKYPTPFVGYQIPNTFCWAVRTTNTSLYQHVHTFC